MQAQQILQRLGPPQGGVFSKADLQTALADPHPTQFARDVRELEAGGVVRRFTRGWYVTADFDLPTLCQRLAPDSYVSLETVLARALWIGPKPTRSIAAVKTGKSRVYEGLGYRVEHLHVAPHLHFGFETDDRGVKLATPEKALLDMFYFHQRGRRYTVDIFSDVQPVNLDTDRFKFYLSRYRNPKFVTFVRKVLRDHD
jgi:hypothetical protein